MTNTTNKPVSNKKGTTKKTTAAKKTTTAKKKKVNKQDNNNSYQNNQVMNNGYVDYNNQIPNQNMMNYDYQNNQMMNNGYVDYNNQIPNQDMMNYNYQNNQMMNNGYMDYSNQIPNQNMMNYNYQNNQMMNNGYVDYNNQIPKQDSEKPKGGKGARVFLIILILALLGSLGYLGYRLYLSYTSSNITSDGEVNYNAPIGVYKDGKFGYVNNKGNFVIEAKYDNASYFFGNYAYVVEKKDVDGNKETVYEVIDTKGNVKFSSSSSSNIKYYDKYNVWVINGELYDNNLNKLSKENVKVTYVVDNYLKWENNETKEAGIINTNGEVTYTYKYKDGENKLYFDASKNDSLIKDRYCRVKVNDKNYGLVDCDNGKVIVDYSTNQVIMKDNNIFKIVDDFSYTTLKTIYVKNDTIAFETTGKYATLTYNSTYGYIKVKESDSDYSYINVIDGGISTTAPSEVKKYNEWEDYTKYTKFSCDSGYGLKLNGEEKVKCEYKDIKYFDLNLYKTLSQNNKNYVLGIKDNITHLIDVTNGKEITSFNTNSVDITSKTPFIYYKDKDTSDKIVYNILNNKKIVINNANKITYYPYYIAVQEGTEMKYYNIDLDLVYTSSAF